MSRPPHDTTIGHPGGPDTPGAELEATKRALHESLCRIDALEAAAHRRPRDLLAMVRGVFARTIDKADTAESAAAHFRGRLDALARYQCPAGQAAGFDLEEMIHDTLMTYAVLDRSRVTIDGQEVRLAGPAAEAIGLALHELTTNAVKFGILSPANPHGALRVWWRVTQGALAFEWEETGMPVLAAAPLRTGFGRDFIERGLPGQLGGQAVFLLAAGQVRYTLSIPMPPREADWTAL